MASAVADGMRRAAALRKSLAAGTDMARG